MTLRVPLFTLARLFNKGACEFYSAPSGVSRSGRQWACRPHRQHHVQYGVAMTISVILTSQFHATLSMLAECVERCPDQHWDGSAPDVVGKYPFWQVAYHALCFVDCYLSKNSETFEKEMGCRTDGFHPAGMKELSEEFPSRALTRDELRRYAAFCRDKVASVLAEESEESLSGVSGFSWLPMARVELHLYNLRHAAHHTGQLTAYLRRVGVQTAWCASDWREPTAM